MAALGLASLFVVACSGGGAPNDASDATTATAVTDGDASGSGDPEPSNADALADEAGESRNAYVAAADARCSEVVGDAPDAVSQFFEDTGGQPTPEQLTTFVNETAVPRLRSLVDELRSLPVPRGEEGAITAVLDAADQTVDELEAEPLSVVVAGPEFYDELNELAAEYGFEICTLG